MKNLFAADEQVGYRWYTWCCWRTGFKAGPVAISWYRWIDEDPWIVEAIVLNRWNVRLWGRRG